MAVSAHDRPVRADLRAVFAAELAERLPRLVDAARCDPPAWDDAVRRDVHTLGSSAWLVGEPELARLARDLEHRVAAGERPSPRGLVTALTGWSP